MGFNLQGYFIQSLGGLKLQEFIPTKDEFESLREKEDYLGVCFIIDNIEKLMWVFQDESIKTKKFVKSLMGESKDEKLAKLTEEVFANELNYDIGAYQVKRALNYRELFFRLFKYQINEYPLYKQHYLLPEFEEEEKEKAEATQTKEEVSSNVRKCANCGWIISTKVTVCPKCHRSPDEKFESE